MRLRGLRFSLRTLLIVMAVAPALLYWFGLPTLNARRYAAALETKNYEAADRLCVDREHLFPGKMKDWLSFAAQAKPEPCSWRDVWRGERRMQVYHQAHVGSVVMSFVGFNVVATRKGIVFPREEVGVDLPEQ